LLSHKEPLSTIFLLPCSAFTLQDEEFLYLVMEYLPGGDVMVSSMTDKHRLPWCKAILGLHAWLTYIHRQAPHPSEHISTRAACIAAFLACLESTSMHCKACSHLGAAAVV
jgi:serine/threonine protein kinase